jgi:alkylation response protein AidB-like acyl-CoA dehydrogenase
MSVLPDSEPMPVDEIYEAIEKLASQFEAEARPCEEVRRPTEALANLMRGARIPMSKVPREIGGCELSPSDQVDFFARLAYLNPTAAWIGFNYSGVAGMIGAMVSDEGVETLWGEGRCPLIAAVSKPSGQSRKVDGGYEVTGHWMYASGVTCADYVLLVTICDDPPGPRAVVLPVDQVELVDDWHVAALQGTGSVDVKVDGAFVPESMTGSPLIQLRGGSQYMRMGYRGYVGGENFGFTLGVAQRLVAEVAKTCKDKKRVLDPNPVGDRGAFQQDLARADMTLRAARALARDELDIALAICDDTKEPLAGSDLARVEASIGMATDMAIQACTRIFPYAGAGALHVSSPIQRAYRDAIGSGQHIVATNETLDIWGRAILSDIA